MANMTSATSPPWGHLSKQVKQDRQYHGNLVCRTSSREPKMIISISCLGLCSSTNLAMGQLLEHLPHWIHARTPLPLGVFATSCINLGSSSLSFVTSPREVLH